MVQEQRYMNLQLYAWAAHSPGTDFIFFSLPYSSPIGSGPFGQLPNRLWPEGIAIIVEEVSLFRNFIPLDKCILAYSVFGAMSFQYR